MSVFGLAGLVALLSLLPLGFVIWVTIQTGWDTVVTLVFRARVGELLVNTVLLEVWTIPLSIVLAVSLAWLTSALLELKGEETTAKWLKGLKENATAYKGNSVAMKAVNAGEIEGAVIYHYYYFGDKAKTGENTKNVSLHYFKHEDPGAFVSISGGGVLASSKHKDDAQAFLKWVTGKAGQAVLKDGDSFEYAVGKDAASNAALVPLGDLQAPKVEPSKLNSKKVTDLMTAAGLL